MITFHVISIFPDSLRSYIDESILKRAQARKLIKIKFYNSRDFATDKRKTTDERPYGGGPGMVMKAEPIIAAAQKAIGRKKNVHTVILSPSGKQITNTYSRKIAKQYRHVVLIAGRYEGIDARVKKILQAEEISIGPYVLTGGELPAAVVIDAVSRHIPGVLGNTRSLEECRTSSSEVYTRPEEFVHKGKTYRVPRVLISGNHKDIEVWKRRHS